MYFLSANHKLDGFVILAPVRSVYPSLGLLRLSQANNSCFYSHRIFFSFSVIWMWTRKLSSLRDFTESTNIETFMAWKLKNFGVETIKLRLFLFAHLTESDTHTESYSAECDQCSLGRHNLIRNFWHVFVWVVRISIGLLSFFSTRSFHITTCAGRLVCICVFVCVSDPRPDIFMSCV